MSPQYAFQTAPMNMPMYARGGLADAAQNLAARGRQGDSMLVHMSPGEVKGLQALAMAHGGTLTTNPQTGLPEAFKLKQLLPLIAGFALGPAGIGLTAMQAGLTVGGIEALRTGDLGRGIMAGLGGFGGAGLGGALSGAGSIGAEAAKTSAMQQAAASQASGLPAALADSAINPDLFYQTPGFDMGSITGAGQKAAADFASQGLGSQIKGSMSAIGQPGGFGEFGSNLVSQYGGKYGAMAAAAPTAMSVSEAFAPKYEFPTTPTEPSTYAGPYVPSERSVRFKRPEDTSTAEFSFFSPSNPVPGYRSMYAAEGGAIEEGNDYAVGGLTALAGGRYLQGPGDGTSDSIPATIGNKQPARLADGEFVIDARTVSEIGNGSSNAGAKKLYKMMDRVHAARKQAKRGQDTKAERYMPA